MQFKSGCGWKACFDNKTGLYTAETSGPGAYDLYEISAEIFDKLGKEGMDDYDNRRLIYDGRHLYMDVNDRCGPPYTVVFDYDYRVLCPWAHIVGGDHVWSDELTDAAVEIFASEANNREQRRKKREEREQQAAQKQRKPRKKKED
ncbi:MAG: hypothetical protein IKX34_07080 [Bacteroidales bacterium]|nr:hypothetical protein [Bacteroidales bacterium]